MIKYQDYTAPLGRILIAGIFIIAGYNKIFGFAGTQGYMDAMGVPGSLLPVVIALEFIGGVAIIIGWQTRLFALALAGFTLLSGIIFHGDFSIAGEMNSFLKNVAITGGFLLLVAQGPGAYALDNRATAKVAGKTTA